MIYISVIGYVSCMVRVSSHVHTSKKYFSYGAVNNMSRVEHTNTQKGQERIPTHTTLSQFQKIKLRACLVARSNPPNSISTEIFTNLLVC
jgi:hypothetical protein